MLVHYRDIPDTDAAPALGISTGALESLLARARRTLRDHLASPEDSASMPDRLAIERFRSLASAYGANIARWPPFERSAARVTALEPEARAILDNAAVLDDYLNLWRVAFPSRELLTGIVRTALPRPRPGRVRLWWFAIGLAATLSRVGAGAIAAAADAPVAGSTAFGDLDKLGG